MEATESSLRPAHGPWRPPVPTIASAGARSRRSSARTGRTTIVKAPPHDIAFGNRTDLGEVPEADLANDAPSVANHGIERNDGRSLSGVDELVQKGLIHRSDQAHRAGDHQEQRHGEPEGACDPDADGRRGLDGGGPERQ